MKYAYTNAQMRMFDEREIARGTNAATLMERAGSALAGKVKAAMERLGVRDAIFVCGGGNNGGDGFVAAEELLKEGFDVAVLCLAERFSGDCKAAKEKYRGEILGRIPRRKYAVAVDCLFGTGLTRPIEGENAALVEFISHADHVIACDIPSGLTDGGIASEICVKADETVCMGQLKTALLLADGADMGGSVSVADIGIPAEGGAEIFEDEDIKTLFPAKKSCSHKGRYGRAGILAGYSSLGAPLLSVGACLKSGAGYTELFLPPEVYPSPGTLLSAAAKYPACILSAYDDRFLPRADAVAFGMGAGVGERQYEMLTRLLGEYRGTLVLDADALNALSVYGLEILKKKGCRVIITPHPMEFSRLTDKSVETLLSDPIGEAKAFSAAYGVTVVFKNNRTVIAEGERTAINVTGSPVLAKGGSGDVLAGLIAGIAARGIPPFEAACAGCFLLGRSGEIAAREMGEYAPDATDILSFLPNAMRSV